MQFSVKMERLVDLLDDASSGALALPEFQRPFVWDPEQMLELLESMRRGWPVGNLLLLDAPQDLGVRPFELDTTPPDPARVRHFLLDGQQRLTSIGQILYDTGDTAFRVDLTEFHSSGEVVIASNKRGSNRDLRIAGTQPTLSEVYFGRVSADIFGGPNPSLPFELAETRMRDLQERLFGDILHGYSIPCTRMNSDIETDAIVEIFETLNRTGTNLETFDLMVAILFARGFDLRKRWAQAEYDHPILKKLGVGPMEILKLILLWTRNEQRWFRRELPDQGRVKGLRQPDVLSLSYRTIERHWLNAASSYAKSAQFFHDNFGVLVESLVPSPYMLLTAAALQNSVSSRDLKAWYWHSISTQTYRTGANTQPLTDVDRFFQGKPLVDTDFFAIPEILSAAAHERAVGNRLLLRGFKGFVIARGGRDPLSGDPLIGDPHVVDFRSISARRVSPMPDLRIGDLTFFNSETFNEARNQIRHSGANSLKHLASQGFDANSASSDSAEHRGLRARWIDLEMGEVLRDHEAS